MRFAHRFALICATHLSLLTVVASTSGQNYLFPDMVPFVRADAPTSFKTLQGWQLTGTTVRFNTIFANFGDGLFEIRRGPDVGGDRHELYQRVYINNDFGSEYEDFLIGTSPIPTTAPDIMWYEDFTEFSLLEAPVVDGKVTVGDEVAGVNKASWRLSANRGPMLSEYTGYPKYLGTDNSTHQRISVGYGDLYSSGSNGQSFSVAGIPVGPRYWLRQTVDPANRIMEADESNNSFEILIDLNAPGGAIMVGGQFVQPGDPNPPFIGGPGDLNRDGFVDVNDWLAFQSGFGLDLSGMSAQEALQFGDMNGDGLHDLHDFTIFRDFFEHANGVGSFAALENTVPEPGTLACAGVLGSCFLLRRSGRRRRRDSRIRRGPPDRSK